MTQNIHIILTQCDTGSPETIAHMKERIRRQLKNLDNIEIFEVVNVSMKKRNGKMVNPYGKEKIAERVFELLLKDIAYKLSYNYANKLWWSLFRMVGEGFSELDDFVDETVKFATLIDFVKDEDKTWKILDERMEDVFLQIEDKTEIIKKQTDEQFTEILRPVSQLYSSYMGSVTNSYIENAGLTFSDSLEWMDVEWIETLDEDMLALKAFPRTGKYIIENEDFPDDDSIIEAIGMVGNAIGDLLSMKKNVKKALEELQEKIVCQVIPSRQAIQAEAYKRIIAYMKPDTMGEM